MAASEVGAGERRGDEGGGQRPTLNVGCWWGTSGEEIGLGHRIGGLRARRPFYNVGLSFSQPKRQPT